MRTHFIIIIIVTYLLASPLSVYADIVIGNEFLYQNEDKAEEVGERYYGKRFIINSPSGYVIPKEEPGSEQGISTSAYSYKGMSPGGREDKTYTYSGDVFVFMNGEIIYITHTFLHNGSYWGVMSPSHTYQPPGWIPMDELLVQYDHQDFEAENKDNFYTYTGSYDAVISAKKLVEWEWPGSDKEKRIVGDYIKEYADVLYAYKDNEGREWGKTKFSERWICLSDPENSKIPAFYPAPQPVKWSPDGIYDWSVGTSDIMFNMLLIVALISVLIICVTVLRKLFWKPNNRKTGGKRDE